MAFLASVSRRDFHYLGSTSVAIRPNKLKMNQNASVSSNSSHYRVDTHTAASVTLIVQSILPVVVKQSFSSTIHLIGGTHVSYSPPFEHLQHVLLPLLRHMGISAHIDLQRTGFYPQGQGSVSLHVSPGPIHSIMLIQQGEIQSISAVIVTNGNMVHYSFVKENFCI